jgi:hypothetical protein
LFYVSALDVFIGFFPFHLFDCTTIGINSCRC